MSKLGTTAAPRGSFLARFFSAAGDGLLADLLAVAALCAGLAGAAPWVALALAGAAFAVAIGFGLRRASARRRDAQPAGRFVLARTLVVFAIATVFAANIAAQPWGAGWVATGLLAGLVVAELTVARVAAGAIPYAAHLPWTTVRNVGRFSAALIFFVNSVAIAVFGALAAAGASALWLMLVPLTAAVPTAASLLDGVGRIRERRRAERGVNAALASYAPVFAVHWDAPRGTEYQLAMWLPYLERLGERFFVIVRDQGTFERVAELTDAPVLLRKTMADLDAMIVPSLRAVFYVNNAMCNSEFVRYSQLTHIQLNHGDSDKAPSYNQVFRMFDKNFVAGQAAIDRFASHGVRVPAEAFSIVGRPQVEGIDVGPRAAEPAAGKTVLYAPTWAGYNEDSNYSSLAIGAEVVRALLDRNCTVIYRPHPYIAMNQAHARQSEQIRALLQRDAATSRRAHVWGAAAEESMGIVDCFNASDALIADVSSVVPDFLYSEKPFAMAMMSVPAADGFVAAFPIAEAAYLIDQSLADLDTSLDALLGPDPLRQTRRRLKTHYLGDFPAHAYADVFLSEARRFLA